MLASFVIALRIDRDLALPGFGGEALHGLFFEALQAHDQGLAKRLHNWKGDRPFGLSGLLGHHPKREGSIQIPADSRVEFRISLLTDELIEQAFATFGKLAMTGTPISFGPGMARIEGIAFQAGAHPLVRSTTYPTLLQGAADEPRVTFRFVSPTSFRAEDIQDILPKPERVFGSLFNTWQAFSPVKLDSALAGTFAHLRISEYALHTELVHFTDYKVIGFKGRVTYSCARDADASTRRAMNALADFAFFAGVGYKTTMGLGQVSRWMP